jgi:hypothetical protein
MERIKVISGSKKFLSGILSFAPITALVLSLSPSTAQASMVTSGLVLHLNGSLPSSYNGTTWFDQSASGTNATQINGPTYNSADGSFTFNGTNQYFNLGNILSFTTAFSVEVTFSSSSLSGNRVLVGRQNSAVAGNYFVGTNNSKVNYYVESTPWGLLSSTTLTTGTKYTATQVYDSSKAITPYLNGVQDGTKTTFTDQLWASNINLQIGAALNRSAASEFFSGKIYSVKIYNRALSASEVLQNYNALAPDTTTPTFTSATSFSTVENISTAATAATIRVSESATVTISSGADAARFNIARSETNTALVKFNLSPNFEAPIDVGGNNVYDLTLTATDLAGNSGTQSITISVTDVVDTSAFNSLSLAGSVTTATYRSAIVITANVTVPSRIRFVVNGKVLPGCASRLTSGTSSSHSTTCTWRPSNRGQVSLTAAATPTGAGISSTTSNPVSIMVGNRVGTR